MKVNVKGKKKVLRELKKHKSNYPDAVSTALYRRGLQIIRGSLRKVPVDTGRLRGSHYVTRPIKISAGHIVELGYGTDYAIRVHESTNLTFNVGQAKYLQEPVEKARNTFADDILDLTRENIRTGKRVSSIPGTNTTPGGGS